MPARFHIQPHRHACYAGPVPFHLASIEAQDHIARSHQQPVGDPLCPGRRERQSLVEDCRRSARLRARGQHAEEFAARRVLRQTARVSAGVNQQRPMRSPPREIPAQNPQCVDRRSAAAYPAVVRIGDHQELRLLGQHSAHSAPFNLIAIEHGLPRRRGRDYQNVPIFQRSSPRRRGICAHPPKEPLVKFH